ncbi:peroxiredoxin [Allopusillimonas ginsengisoli]|uniref:peroxiredoxin n=1 Tax=Allopusillimonas ginsengisoli TaxID=453575 RepID=UPI0010C1723B|nr:peroxiredoxin [Allopusillimonas ginsengisoli]
MSLRIGDIAPDFEAETSEGKISFHKWLGNSWGVLFSHPKDFTPICTTELGFMAGTKAEYDKRNAKILAVSVDSVEDHKKWAQDIGETQGTAPNYPIIGDVDLKVAKLYNMLPAGASGDVSTRTPVDNQTVRNVFLISPEKKISLILIYPMSVGRNFNEILRVLDALQLTHDHKVATPANWGVEGHSKDVAISTSVSTDDAKKMFPKGVKELKPYLRMTPDPR